MYNIKWKILLNVVGIIIYAVIVEKIELYSYSIIMFVKPVVINLLTIHSSCLFIQIVPCSASYNNFLRIYHRQHNKCYPQRCLLAHNNRSQICNSCQISLQSAVQLTAILPTTFTLLPIVLWAAKYPLPAKEADFG